jgi:hypothetical protein
LTLSPIGEGLRTRKLIRYWSWLSDLPERQAAGCRGSRLRGILVIVKNVANHDSSSTALTQMGGRCSIDGSEAYPPAHGPSTRGQARTMRAP